MSIKALTVALESDMSADHVAPLIEAIRQLRHVGGVTALEVDTGDFVARMRATNALMDKLLELHRRLSDA